MFVFSAIELQEMSCNSKSRSCQKYSHEAACVGHKCRNGGHSRQWFRVMNVFSKELGLERGLS